MREKENSFVIRKSKSVFFLTLNIYISGTRGFNKKNAWNNKQEELRGGKQQ